MGANTAAQTIGQHGLTPAGATPLDIAMRYFQPNLSDNKPWFKEKELAQKATVQLLLDHTQDIEPQILEQLEKWGFSKERAEEAHAACKQELGEAQDLLRSNQQAGAFVLWFSSFDRTRATRSPATRARYQG